MSEEHYFSADPSVPFKRVPVTATVWGREMTLTSGSGVFAQGRVWGVDVNERALLLADENARALGVEARFTAATPDGVPPDVTFDEIWSNPPIRIGKEALHELLLTRLPRLSEGGRAVLVVGKNLGGDSLQRWLGEQGWPTTRLGSAKGFRVLEVRRDV